MQPNPDPVALERIGDLEWEIPRNGPMRVPGRIYASAEQMETLRGDPCLGQVRNVACLPGIVTASLGMPDIHWGYGFPIGGVAATDVAEGGVVSPGGVGFDISCGVRLLVSDTDADDAAALAKLPSKDQLRAQILGCLSGPARGLVTVLAGPGSGLARVIQARIDEAGGTGATEQAEGSEE